MKNVTTEGVLALAADYRVLLFMNGSANAPRSGYSSRAVEVLSRYPIDVHTVDAFSDEELRKTLVATTRWPTIPQLFVNGEFIGGSDLLFELDHSGELATIVNCSAGSSGLPAARFTDVTTAAYGFAV